MLRTRLLNGLALPFALFVYVFSDSYLGLLLLVVTLSLYIVSWVCLLVVKNKVTVTMDHNRSFYKSQPGIIQIHVKNRSWLPIAKLKLQVHLTNRLIGEANVEDFYATLSGKSSVSLPLTLKSQSIGHIQVNVLSVSMFDLLGNFKMQQKHNEHAGVYILPLPHQLNFLNNEQVAAETDLTQVISEEKGENSSDIIGHKEYEMGDNLKQINWKLSSKIDNLMLKEMSQPKESSYFILLETAIHRHEPDQINVMVELLYSLSSTLLNNGQIHSIGWFDQEIDDLKQMEVTSHDQLNTSLRSMLTIHFKQVKATSLTSFLQSEKALETSQLYYIKPADLESSDITSLNSTITTIQCSSTNESNQSGGIVVTPDMMEKHEHQIII